MTPQIAPCLVALAAVFHCHDAPRSASTSPSDPSPPVAAAPAPAAPTAKTEPLSCSFHWRKSDAHSFRKGDEKALKLTASGDAHTVELGDVQIAVGLDDNGAGGRQVSVAIDLDAMQIDDAYDFGTAASPANLPPGGHGFTGLHYVKHPGSGSELQYWCEAGDPPEPGTVSASRTPITCETIAGSKRDTHRLTDSTLATSAGGTHLAVRHLPGEHDAGGVIVDFVAKSGGGVHVLYQLLGDELPVNLFANNAGFTGRTTITDPATGDAVAYSCSATP